LAQARSESLKTKRLSPVMDALAVKGAGVGAGGATAPVHARKARKKLP
jgi:hypothetical protein